MKLASYPEDLQRVRSIFTYVQRRGREDADGSTRWRPLVIPTRGQRAETRGRFEWKILLELEGLGQMGKGCDEARVIYKANKNAVKKITGMRRSQ